MKSRDREGAHDLLRQYLHEISQYPRLSPERERELGRLVQQGDARALDELVRGNLRFVVSYAKRYRNPHVQFLDLINEGNIGLMQAAKKFDPDKNVKFITYAVWWIRQAILQALSEQGGTFRLPPKRANLMHRLEKAISTALLEESHFPTPEELAAQLEISVGEVHTLLQASHDSFSLSEEIDGDSRIELSDLIEQTTVEAADETMRQRDLRTQLLERFQILKPRERMILTLRFGVSDNLPKPVEEVARFLEKDVDDTRAILERSIYHLCTRLEVQQSELSHLLLLTNPNPEASWTFWVSLPDLPETLSSRVDPSRATELESLRNQGILQIELDTLPVLDRTIVKLRYGVLDEELTLKDIGEMLNLSRERVRQIEAKAGTKCRRAGRIRSR
jgi:RNA polymerase primary sigma factor